MHDSSKLVLGLSAVLVLTGCAPTASTTPAPTPTDHKTPTYTVSTNRQGSSFDPTQAPLVSPLIESRWAGRDQAHTDTLVVGLSVTSADGLVIEGRERTNGKLHYSTLLAQGFDPAHEPRLVRIGDAVVASWVSTGATPGTDTASSASGRHTAVYGLADGKLRGATLDDVDHVEAMGAYATFADPHADAAVRILLPDGGVHEHGFVDGTKRFLDAPADQARGNGHDAATYEQLGFGSSAVSSERLDIEQFPNGRWVAVSSRPPDGASEGSGGEADGLRYITLYDKDLSRVGTTVRCGDADGGRLLWSTDRTSAATASASVDSTTMRITCLNRLKGTVTAVRNDGATLIARSDEYVLVDHDGTPLSRYPFDGRARITTVFDDGLVGIVASDDASQWRATTFGRLREPGDA